MFFALSLTLAVAPPVNTDVFGDPLPPGAIARLGTARFRHVTDGGAVALSRDGGRIASVGVGRIRLIDAADGRVVREVATNAFRPQHWAAVSADARFAAVAVRDDTDDNAEGPGGTFVRVIDLDAGRTVRVIGRPAASVSGMAFSPDAKFLAVVFDGRSARVVEVATGRVVAEEVVAMKTDARAESLFVYARPAFSRDGKTIAFAASDARMRVWSWRSGRPSLEWDVGRVGFQEASFGVGDTALVYLGGQGRVTSHDIASGKETGIGAANSTALAHSPDGRYLATAEGRGTIRLRDAKTLAEVGSFAATGSWVRAMAFSADGSRLVTQDDGGVRLWAIPSIRELRPVPTPLGAAEFVALSGDVALTIHGRGANRSGPVLWHASAGRPRVQLPTTPKDWQYAVALSPDGRTIATTPRNLLRLTDAASGRLIAEHGHIPQPGSVEDVAFSADGRRVHLITSHGRLVSRCAETGRIVADVGPSFDGKGLPAEEFGGGDGTDVRFAPGGRFLLFGTLAAYFVFDTETGSRVGRLAFPDKYDRTMALSPDGRTVLEVASGSGLGPGRGVRRLHDAATGRVVRKEDSALPVSGPACFSPDGTWYAVTSSRLLSRYTVAVRETRTGRLLADIDVPGGVTSIAASADGRGLIVGLEDSTALVYPIPDTKDRR